MRSLWIGALALLLIGCEQKSEAPSSGSAPAKAGASAAPPAGPAGAVAQTTKDEEISTEADFEEEAEKDITAENLDAELDKLDKEIGQ